MSSAVMTSCRTLTLCALLLFVAVVAADEECDPTQCPGPLKYLKDLGCQPLFVREGDCCPYRFDCDHLYARENDKCYVNNNVYNVGDRLKPEDTNPCDRGCRCGMGRNGIASFTCAIVDCYHGDVTPGCFRRMSPTQCCSQPEVCIPEEERATCEVEGKVYKDGEHFKVSSDPDLNCFCQPGYTGENVLPFCAKPNRPYCSPEFRHAENVRNWCAPVFYENQTPQTSCSVTTRCESANDTVITTMSSDELRNDDLVENMCKFGNHLMHVGDTLNEKPDYGSACIKCVCEVAPVPTCRRVPISECSTMQ